MKNTWLLVVLLGLSPCLSLAQTTADLINDSQDPVNVLTHSMGYDRKSYSPLEQINTTNINRLVPIWNASVMNDFGELAAPVVHNGVM